jgi:hypothetical protein
VGRGLKETALPAAPKPKRRAVGRSKSKQAFSSIGLPTDFAVRRQLNQVIRYPVSAVRKLWKLVRSGYKAAVHHPPLAYGLRVAAAGCVLLWCRLPPGLSYPDSSSTQIELSVIKCAPLATWPRLVLVACACGACVGCDAVPGLSWA